MRHEVAMFESQYNEERAAEVKRLEARQRAIKAGHPEWGNACANCGCQFHGTEEATCDDCR